MLTDVLLATALTGLTTVTLVTTGDGQPHWLASTLGFLSVAPVALRQWAPVGTLAVMIGALVLYGLLGFGVWPNTGLGIVVGLFSVATLRSRRTAAVMYAMTLLAALVAYQTFPVPLTVPEILQYVLVMAITWAVGDGTRRWALRVERAAAKTAEAVVEERVRIAREMHDIVSHHMSVISLQAGVAEYVLDSDPATARTAISTVGEAGREALSEMRRLLDVLRIDHDKESLRPQPGLADLDDLVGRIRSAGLTVDVSVTGRVRPLAAGPDLCAYRVVQESLTNVLQHAGPATARVDVDYGELTLAVTITDDGTKTYDPPPSPDSHGIRGMRERAALYGGVLTAGRHAGGFRVLLRLPIEESPA
ncbi:signal transduction histidine kinase [Catenuloplanes nepalensis]|uniref:histidine kinase n=1 Tax=Catenuloplanes nepalensis TaxID=587533 RepID=A0ABT9MUR7_9ACTN|nr:sensor histidine kinase [Catenuloplanes nepalensis]MDP9795109.1 signal transduction histidine kinase [Catenuloplanes nepalensis]